MRPGQGLRPTYVHPGLSRRALDRRAGDAAGTVPLETPSFPLKGVDAQASAADERAATSFQAGAMAFAVAPAPVLAVQGMARAQAWGGNPHAWMARKRLPLQCEAGAAFVVYV